MTLQDYVGRPWDHDGGSNCFTIAQEVLKGQLGLDLFPQYDDMRKDEGIDTYYNWWDRRGSSWYLDLMEEEGWREIPLSDLKFGDGLLFRLASKIPNHCAVYIGDNQIIHQLAFGESRIDPFHEGSTMHKRVHMALRHHSQFV